MIDLKALRALALATQEFNSGEWMACGPSFGAPNPAYLDEVVAMDGEDEDCRICAAPEWSKEHFAERSANMEFIAAANPAVILALIERLEAAEAAPLPAEQPSNPVTLTDKQKANIGHAALILKREGHAQLADSLQGILARIVGQQTKGGGNG